MIQLEETHIDQVTEALYHLLNGNKVSVLPIPSGHAQDEIGQMYGYFNALIETYDEMAEFLFALSRGELDYVAPKGKLVVLQAFKSFQANLKHLTWVTQQIAEGDFRYQVDFLGDFSTAFNDMTRQLKEAFEEIQRANKTMKEDQERIDKLLRNVLPNHVIEELEKTGRTTPKLYDNVTVFFSDIVDFTKSSVEIDPVMLLDELNAMFSAFDEIVIATGGERIKTIGDAFMAVWGLHKPLPDHAEKAVEAALKILEYQRKRNEDWFLQWQLRIGIHSGSVVGGVVGVTKYIYDVFGDTVNTASRMESNSEAMRINISEATYERIKNKYTTIERPLTEVKGKGDIKMYFVEGE